MKTIFFYIMLLTTVLCAGIINAMAQTMDKPTAPQTQIAGTTNTPKFKTEAEQLANIDLTTKQGQLKRLVVQKAFYLQNNDAATAAKIDAAINAIK